MNDTLLQEEVGGNGFCKAKNQLKNSVDLKEWTFLQDLKKNDIEDSSIATSRFIKMHHNLVVITDSVANGSVILGSPK